MKTYVTTEFKYDNKNYLFYGDTRKEVKEKIDTWMKENDVSNRPYYTYNDFDSLVTTDDGLKEKVKNKVDSMIWNNKHNDKFENFIYKNGVRTIGWMISLLICGIILYEIRKYMLYPYFVEFVNNRPENLMTGLNNIMNFGWDIFGIMILFYWKTEILMVISGIIGWFTPNIIEKYLYKKNMKKMEKYKNSLIVI